MIRLLATATFILLLRGKALVRPRTAREKNVAASAKRIREGRRVGLSAIRLAKLDFGLRAAGRYEEKFPALQQAQLPFECFAFDPVDGFRSRCRSVR